MTWGSLASWSEAHLQLPAVQTPRDLWAFQVTGSKSVINGLLHLSSALEGLERPPSALSVCGGGSRGVDREGNYLIWDPVQWVKRDATLRPAWFCVSLPSVV